MGKGTSTRTYVSAAEVLYRLAEIEQEGVEFYEGLSEGARSEWVKKFAKMFVKAERRHRRRFLEYAHRAEQKNAPDSNQLLNPLPPEVARLLGTRVLAPKDRVRKSAVYATGEEALKVAIRAEEHIALLLTQLREYVAANQRRYISRVIKEEWAHKDYLEELFRTKFL